MRIARNCGYELAVSYRQGVNWLGALQAIELRRIGIAPGITASQFRVMLALPGWLHPNFDRSTSESSHGRLRATHGPIRFALHSGMRRHAFAASSYFGFE